MAYDATTGQGIDEELGRALTPEELAQQALRAQAQSVSAQGAGGPGPDPFAAMGGGVLINGGWVPNSNPAAQTPTATASAPGATPTSAPTPAGAPGPDPFAAMGGGVLINGGWVPRDNPAAQQAGAAAPTSAAAVAPGAPGAAGMTAAGSIPAQAAAASGYTPTPLANPTNPTTNAGSQDVVRNSYLQMATQPIVPDANDPAVRRPADAYAANVERSVRSNIADAAEANGPYATGAQTGTSRMLRERGGALTGEYESNLVLREMSARRQEIQSALSGLSGAITEDQRQALQKQLAQIDATLRSQALSQQGDQFNNEFGLNLANSEASWNDIALRHILSGQ